MGTSFDLEVSCISDMKLYLLVLCAIMSMKTVQSCDSEYCMVVNECGEYGNNECPPECTVRSLDFLNRASGAMEEVMTLIDKASQLRHLRKEQSKALDQ